MSSETRIASFVAGLVVAILTATGYGAENTDLLDVITSLVTVAVTWGISFLPSTTRWKDLKALVAAVVDHVESTARNATNQIKREKAITLIQKELANHNLGILRLFMTKGRIGWMVDASAGPYKQLLYAQPPMFGATRNTLLQEMQYEKTTS